MWGFGFMFRRFFTVSSKVAIAPPEFHRAVWQARLKVDRANRHALEAEAVLKTFAASDFCTPFVKFDVEKRCHVLGVEASEPPPDFSLAVGDCFRNLDSALDYLACGIMRALTGSDTRIHFPVDESREALKSTFKRPRPGKGAPRNRRIVEACPALILLILCKIKPYKGGNFLAWEIRKAANADKHNMIIPTLQLATLHDLVVTGPEDCPYIHYSTFKIQAGGSFGAYRSYAAPLEIKHYGQATFSVSFPDSAEVFAGDPVVPTLLQCIQGTTEVINLCERHLSGAF